MPLREIDALFGDRGIPLGTGQPRENDNSVRRERLRRYLATLGPRDAADAAAGAGMTDCATSCSGSCERTASRSPARCAWLR